jgi:hypothetical protein
MRRHIKGKEALIKRVVAVEGDKVERVMSRTEKL